MYRPCEYGMCNVEACMDTQCADECASVLGERDELSRYEDYNDIRPEDS